MPVFKVLKLRETAFREPVDCCPIVFTCTGSNHKRITRTIEMIIINTCIADGLLKYLIHVTLVACRVEIQRPRGA
jgi:hypothetical protein